MLAKSGEDLFMDSRDRRPTCSTSSSLSLTTAVDIRRAVVVKCTLTRHMASITRDDMIAGKTERLKLRSPDSCTLAISGGIWRNLPLN